MTPTQQSLCGLGLSKIINIFKYILIIPGPCKGEPGLYFTISLSTEMTPALRGPAADDQMLRCVTWLRSSAKVAPLQPIKCTDMSRGCMGVLWRRILGDRLICYVCGWAQGFKLPYSTPPDITNNVCLAEWLYMQI